MVDRSVFLTRMLENISDVYDKSEGSLIWDILMPLAIGCEEMTREADIIEKGAFMDTATGTWLDSLGLEHGLVRRGASQARGTVTFFGSPGTVIPQGTYVTNGVSQYITVSETVINEDGNAEADIVCTEAGESGNCAAGYVNRTNISFENITDVINKSPVTGGANEESDELYRKRLLYRASHPVYAGNAAQYVMWAQGASNDVGAVRCIPVWNGAGTVKVVLVDSGMKSPDEELLNTVRAEIENNMPCVGVELTVCAPREKAISVEISGDTVPSGSTENSVRESIEKYFREITLTENTVKYSRVCEAVLDASEIFEFTSLKLCNTYGNVKLEQDEFPVLSALTFVTA